MTDLLNALGALFDVVVIIDGVDRLLLRRLPKVTWFFFAAAPEDPFTGPLMMDTVQSHDAVERGVSKEGKAENDRDTDGKTTEGKTANEGGGESMGVATGPTRHEVDDGDGEDEDGGAAALAFAGWLISTCRGGAATFVFSCDDTDTLGAAITGGWGWVWRTRVREARAPGRPPVAVVIRDAQGAAVVSQSRVQRVDLSARQH